MTQVDEPIHVSFSSADNVVPDGRYRLYVREYKLSVSEAGNTMANVQFAFDADRHSELKNRKQFDRFVFVPAAMWRYQRFLVQAGINKELLREEPIVGADGTVQVGPDDKPLTRCAYSVKDQLGAIIGAVVYADLEQEEYDGVAADGVTPTKRKRSVVKQFSAA